ncbi:alpha/beta fold hydrolase [Streptomyces sp. NPDC050548]|uniref:alpha/beta fold hydrolase n=1 Tax=Streptomyces sp. NPDC050548 TaxID=3365629 RepID=UPI00379C5BA9
MTAHNSPVAAPPAEGPVSGMDGFFHRYSDVDGVRLHHVVGGEGPPVVLLHGWPYTWAVWRRLMPLLAAAGFTVVAPDLRGTGDSDKPDSGYAKSEVAEDLRRIVAGLAPAGSGDTGINLVGMDVGAMVAHAYATAHPREVRRLVLSESVLPGFGLEELMNPATGGYWHFGFHMQLDIAELLTAGKEADYLAPAWAIGSPAGGLTDADRAEFLRHYSAPGGMRGGFQHYATLLEDGRAIRATGTTKLPMPVLVLNAVLGLPQAPLLEGVRQIADDIQADLVPDSGHAYAADNPAWTAQRLTAFFAGPAA